MRTYPSSITNYREAGRAHGQVDYLSIRVRDIGSPSGRRWFHFCSLDDESRQEVVDPDDDSETPVERRFLGGGHIVAMPDVIRSEKAKVQSLTFVLSGTSPEVLDMIHGHDTRGATFQWFVGEVNHNTGRLLDMPECEHVGEIGLVELLDSAHAVDSAEPAESIVSITVEPLSAQLTGRNFDMRDVDVSEGRSGDRFFSYSDNAPTIRVWWGKEKKSERDRKGGDKGETKDKTMTPRP